MGGVVDRLDSCITLQRPQQAEGMNREDAHDIQYAKPCTWGGITLGTGTYMLGTNQLESSLAEDAGTWQTTGWP